MKSKRGRPRTFNREATLSKAMQLYWEDGLDGLSINEVCRRIQISKPTLYREFDGEDGLLESVVELYTKQVISAVGVHLQGSAAVCHKLNALVDAMTTKTDSPMGCLLVDMRCTQWRLGPRAMASLHAVREMMNQRYVRMVVEGQGRGEIRSDLDADVVARFIDTQLTMILLHMKVGKPPEEIRVEGKLALSVLYT